MQNINMINTEFLIEEGKGSALYKYSVCNIVKEITGNLIKKHDTENLYSSSNVVLDFDEDVKIEAKKKYEEEYKVQLEELERIKQEWKNNNSEKYRIQPSLQSSEMFKISFMAVYEGFFEELTLCQLVHIYKYSSQILKSIKNEDLDKYCVDNKSMLNYDFKAEYDSFIEKSYQDLEIPKLDVYMDSKFEKTNVKKSRISLDRKEVDEDSLLSTIIKDYEKLLDNYKVTIN